jgi:hypothetical protein
MKHPRRRRFKGQMRMLLWYALNVEIAVTEWQQEQRLDGLSRAAEIPTDTNQGDSKNESTRVCREPKPPYVG